VPRKIAEGVREQVPLRARSLCEYCHTDETWQYVPFTIDHVVPLSAGGRDDLDNLALACFQCNRGINPRQHRWAAHFIWSANGLQIIPLTPTGRVTVAALGVDRERLQQIRSADVVIGRHPPNGDPVEQAKIETLRKKR